jgi:hypothetical protein
MRKQKNSIMKNIITTLIVISIATVVTGQNITKISAFYNAYNESSGIIGINENGVYQYSWYYDAWLEFPSNGLAFVGEKPKIDAVSAFDNNSLNPSGIYVISDTAVHVYNYYTEYWYALKNTGLERIEGIVQMTDLSAHYDAEYDNVDVYVKSGEHIYYYGWYTQQWYPLSNDGLSSKNQIHNYLNDCDIYPNPVTAQSKLKITLPEGFSGNLHIAVFTLDSKFIKEIFVSNPGQGAIEIDLNAEGLMSGTYFCEIKGLNFSHVKKFIKFE